MIKISVSSLPFNDNILENLPMIIESKADFLHLDIMDGSLTENKTFLAETVKEIDKNTTLFLDCHLMIDNPIDVLKDYVKAGANIVTIHYEAFKDKVELIKALKEIEGKRVLTGLSIYPNTTIEEILPFKDYFDVLLIMSVEIGKYGQKFIENTYEKIRQAKQLLPDKLIEVDGGINEENISKLAELSVDFAVVGSSFKNAENKVEFITKLKK